MYSQIVVAYSSEDSIIPIRRIISTIGHEAVTQIRYVSVNLKSKVKVAELADVKVVLLLGTEIINHELKSVRGRNAAIKKDGIWYLTLNNTSIMYQPEISIASALQVIKAIRIIEHGFEYPKVERFTIPTLDYLKQVVQEAVKSDYIGFDFETNNKLLVHDPDFVATCLGFCFNPGWTYIVPQELLYTDGCSEILSDLFSCSAVKIAHNIQFDIKILWKLNIKVQGRLGCTKLMSFILDENYSTGLKEAVDRYLPDYSGYDYEVDFVGDTEKLYDYLAIDAHVALLLYSILMPEIVADPYFYPLYRNVYLPGMQVIAKMEYDGAYVDTEYLSERIAFIQNEIQVREAQFQEYPEVKRYIILRNEHLVETEIKTYIDKINVRSQKFDPTTDKHIQNWQSKVKALRAGEIVLFDFFNIGSTKDLGELLYTNMGFSFPRPQRPTGQWKNGKKIMAPSMSTDKEALEDLKHPIAEVIRVIRSFNQLLSTFYVSIHDKAIEGKLYASFNQTGTSTGRLSSSDPNLQNLPTRVHLPDEILKGVVKGVKKAFIAPFGYKVLAADLSQAELRTIAHFSRDENMIMAYLNNIDIHAITGQRIAKCETLEEFLASPDFKKKRADGKTGNFGIVYGISLDGYIDYVKSVTGDLITRETAQLHFDSVFGAYPRLLDWHQRMEDQVRDQGFVRTLQGLKRRLPGVYSESKRDVADAIRLAINNPVQGTIGLYALYAMVWISHRYPEFKFFTSVHDSMVGYCPIGLEKEISLGIKETANNLPTQLYLDMDELAVPLTMDTEVGDSYGSLEEI